MIALLLAAVMFPTVPGTLNPNVTQANIGTTICASGWTATVRPSSGYTTALKRTQMASLGLPGTTADYQEDHLISLELGGAPRDPQNLWPEPWTQARRDDRLENRWHRHVCNGDYTLRHGRWLERRYKHLYG